MEWSRSFASSGLALLLSVSAVWAQHGDVRIRANDVVVQDHHPWYLGAVNDGPRGLPFPPLDQIPPVLMPNLGECIDNAHAPGSVLVYDARTGDTIELPGAHHGPGGSVRGFRGLDGGDRWNDQGGRGFGCMTPVADTKAFPYRINAKAVMRFTRMDGSTHWSSCSAAMQDAEVALLAGHCIFNRDSNIMDYAEEVFIIPGWDGVGTAGPPDAILNPYGWARGDYYIVGTEWVYEGNVNYDMAAVVVTRAAGMLTGWFGRSWDDPCVEVLDRTYYNGSYPASCYNGRDLQFWQGNFDSCPSGNKLQIDFDGALCCNELQGGMSGSNAYFAESTDLFAHAVASHGSDTYGRYTQMWTGFHDDLTMIVDDVARGSALDIQPLDCGGPAKALPGASVNLNHVCANPTNFDPPSRSYTFTWYLSDNEQITAADTALTTRMVELNLSSLAIDPALAMATVLSSGVQIPANTPYGTYWLGVIYDSSTDGTPGNNAATTWDAHRIIIGIFP